jgi:hypothetical protein
MPPTLQATITAKTGPADQMTAIVLTGVTVMALEPGSQVCRFRKSDGSFLDIDMNGVTTFTVTISGGNFTVTIS